MELHIGLRELVSWIFTIISATLFIQNRIKNSSMQYYMALQGILLACHKKAVFYSALARESKDPETKILYEHVTSDFYSLTQHLMGTMKSIQFKKDLPFDVITFINSGVEDKTKKID